MNGKIAEFIIEEDHITPDTIELWLDNQHIRYLGEIEGVYEVSKLGNDHYVLRIDHRYDRNFIKEEVLKILIKIFGSKENKDEKIDKLASALGVLFPSGEEYKQTGPGPTTNKPTKEKEI